MNNLLFYFAVLCTVTPTIAQVDTTEDRTALEPYVGVPNNANYLLYQKYSGSDSSVTNYRTIGTPVLFGFRAELSSPLSRIGLGVDVNYEQSGFQHNYIDTSYTNSTMGIDEYELKYKANKLRIMLRLSYYFVNRPKIQTSVNISAGYKYFKRLEESSDPNFLPIETKNSIPFAGRVAVTLKVYPVDPVGIFIELGAFGGSIIQTGLSLRF